MNKVWIIEYNTDLDNPVDDRSWHIELLSHSIITNQANVLNKRETFTWTILGMAESFEEAQVLKNRLKRMVYGDHKDKDDK